jgi:aspartate aminotransferase
MKEAKDVFAAVCGAGRSLGFVCAPSLWQAMVERLQGVTCEVEAYRRNRDRLSGALTKIGYTVTPPDGAFYLFVKSPEEDAAAFAERLKKYEILVVPSDSFGVKGYVRIAYCVDPDTIERSLEGFEKTWGEYQK